MKCAALPMTLALCITIATWNSLGIASAESLHAGTDPRGAAVFGAPYTSAQATFILDDTSGRTLYSFHPNQERYVASTQKMLTALVALKRLPLNRIVTVPAEAIVGGTTAGLYAGERMRVRDLFYGMLLPSGNDAAIALADAAAGTQSSFASLMNAEANTLHLRHSHFLIPHGFDVPGQYSTAHDLATVAHALLRRSFLARIVRTRSYTARSADGVRIHAWVNLDELLGHYPGIIGVKTGTTPGAGANLVSCAVRGAHRIIVVLLGDTVANRFPDATRLLNYGWRLLGYRVAA
jgi:D-alanyl-D-alanine carboxypeptidase (penicillin-binding protein 5/6)